MPYLFGASGPVTTHITPSTASAFDVSIFLIRACGYGECRILPVNIPGSDRSSAYLPCPVVLPAESTRATRLPMMEKSDIFSEVPNARFLRVKGPLFPFQLLATSLRTIHDPVFPRRNRATSLRSGFQKKV